MEFERFVELLILSKITTEQQMEELLCRFEDERKELANDDDAINQVCDFLKRTGSVTEWQCEKLKMGKWKGFYLDCYLMLGQVGKDETTCSYIGTRPIVCFRQPNLRLRRPVRQRPPWRLIRSPVTACSTAGSLIGGSSLPVLRPRLPKSIGSSATSAGRSPTWRTGRSRSRKRRWAAKPSSTTTSCSGSRRASAAQRP
jgi:hypothetical protein